MEGLKFFYYYFSNWETKVNLTNRNMSLYSAVEPEEARTVIKALKQSGVTSSSRDAEDASVSYQLNGTASTPRTKCICGVREPNKWQTR